MTLLSRVRVALTGFPGGPGVATHYLLDASANMADLHSFWDIARLVMPSSVHLQIESAGDIIEDTDGSLVGSWSEPITAAMVGGDSGNYAAPSGACVNWLTGTVLDRHRVMGRTFIVPVLSAALAGDGTLSDSTLSSLQTAGTTLATACAGNLVVWHRPRIASAGPPAVTARAGGHAAVTACRVPDKSVVLRSRRD